jgi:predicted MFS family arabinose efflux permease
MKEGKAMGSVMSAFAIASTFGVPFSLYLANIISWHAPFLLVGILGIVLVPLLVKYIPSMDQHLLNRAEKNLHSKPYILLLEIKIYCWLYCLVDW